MRAKRTCLFCGPVRLSDKRPRQEAPLTTDVLLFARHRGNTLLAHGQLKIRMGESIRARNPSWQGLDAAQAESVEADELLVQAG